MRNHNDQLQLAITSSRHVNHEEEEDDDELIREIHALTPPRQQPTERTTRARSSASSVSVASSENFTSMSREFNALVVAGSSIADHQFREEGSQNNLEMIGEEEEPPYRETNPLAIVPDTAGGVTATSPRRTGGGSSSAAMVSGEATVQMVKREEVESKISAWETAKIAKVNNRFKREDAIINGWESEEVQKATSWMKKVERKLEEKRAKALEKMQNDIAKARRKAEERRASAEGKRGTKVAAIVELVNLMRAVGRPPVKRSFF